MAPVIARSETLGHNGPAQLFHDGHREENVTP
jgi:hypothetical protein